MNPKTRTVTLELLRWRRDFRGGEPGAVRVIRTDEERMVARSVTRLLSLGIPKES